MYAEQQKRFFALMKQFGRMRSKVRFKNLSQSEFMMLGVILHGAGGNIKCDRDQMLQPQKEGILVSAVTDKMGGSKSSTSKTLRSLEEKGYIERKLGQKDRRQIYIMLTEQGHQILLNSQGEMDTFARAVIERMGEDDIESLLHLLEKLSSIMEDEIKKRKEKDKKNG